MYINAESDLFYCADCGSAGNAKDEFFPFSDALFPGAHIEREREEIVQMYGHSPVLARSGETMDNGVQLPGQLVRLADLPNEHPAWEYLISRRFDVDEIRHLEPSRELFYVSGLTLHGGGHKRAVGRILFPIRSGGVLSGWQARRIERPVSDTQKEVWDGKIWKPVHRGEDGKWADKHIPKYQTSQGFQTGQTLYNLDSAREYSNLHGGSYAILCEGPLDVIRVGIRGVGSFGAPTSTQKKILDASFDFIIMLLDPDINAMDNPAKFIKYTTGWGIPVMWLYLPDGKDPGATPRHVIADSIASALNARAGITHSREYFVHP